MLWPRDRQACIRTLEFGAWPLVARRCAGTAEDFLRAQAYDEEEQRQKAVRHAPASASSLSDLLRSLQVEIKVETEVAGHEQRLAQLTARTNQFNGKNQLKRTPVSQRARSSLRLLGAP